MSALYSATELTEGFFSSICIIYLVNRHFQVSWFKFSFNHILNSRYWIHCNEGLGNKLCLQTLRATGCDIPGRLMWLISPNTLGFLVCDEITLGYFDTFFEIWASHPNTFHCGVCLWHRYPINSYSNFRLEDSAICLTSEQSTVDMDRDDGSVLDVYFVSAFVSAFQFVRNLFIITESTFRLLTIFTENTSRCEGTRRVVWMLTFS